MRIGFNFQPGASIRGTITDGARTEALRSCAYITRVPWLAHILTRPVRL